MAFLSWTSYRVRLVYEGNATLGTLSASFLIEKPKKLRTIISLTVFLSKCETCFVTFLYPVCSNMCRQNQRKKNSLGKQEAWRHILVLHGEMMREQRTCDGYETHHNVMSSDTQMSKYPSFNRTERHLNSCNRFQWKVEMLGWVLMPQYSSCSECSWIIRFSG